MRVLVTCLALLVLVLMTACVATPLVNADRPSPTAMTNLSAPVAELLKSFVSEQSGLPEAQISLQQAEATHWTNSCLGLEQPDEMCLQAITPGYRVTFATPKGEYVVHNSQNGRSRRLASP